jgi:hypothetical protein
LAIPLRSERAAVDGLQFLGRGLVGVQYLVRLSDSGSDMAGDLSVMECRLRLGASMQAIRSKSVMALLAALSSLTMVLLSALLS